MKFQIKDLKKNYSIIPNSFLWDKRLTLEEKGLMTTMYSLPESWDYSMEGLCTITNTGIKKLRRIICMLEINGYVTRKIDHDHKGRFEYNYIIRITPKKTNVKNSLSMKKFIQKNQITV